MNNASYTAESIKDRFTANTPVTSYAPIQDAPDNNDNTVDLNDTAHMDDQITRHELDAKLETIEARMDARVAAIGGKIDTFLAAQSERDKATNLHFSHIESDISELKVAFSSMKSTTIVTAISVVLAIVIGIGAFNATLTSNMIASFQLGNSQAAVQEVEQPAPPALTAKPKAK